MYHPEELPSLRFLATLRNLGVAPYRCIRELMHARCLLFCVLYARYFYYVGIRRRLRILEGLPHVALNTIMNNLYGLRPGLTCDRSLWIIRPVSVLETLGPRWETRILCVGPRTEGELFRLWSHGYKLCNIRGLDVISYSPYIDLGDMHDMPYADNSFDLVLCGWTLAYSENKPKAAEEIARVVRRGGVVAVGVQYVEMTNEELIKAHGYLAGSKERITSVKQILSYFEGKVEHVYFDHDIVKGVNSISGNLMVIFSISK